MTTGELAALKIWFSRYTGNYMTDSMYTVYLRPRLDHILRVAENCRQLAIDLGWSENGVRLAEAVGLLHDIGRFSQFADYGTFEDSGSVDHTARGYDVAQTTSAVSSLDDFQRGILLDCIRHHRGRNIPADIGRDAIPYLRVLRDADRLDRFRVTLDLVRSARSGDRLNLDIDGPVNPQISEAVELQELASKKNIKTTLDFFLFRLSALFAIEYPQTFARLCASGIVEETLAYFPDNPAVNPALESIRAFLTGKCS